MQIDIGTNASPKIQLIRQQLSRALAVFFTKTKNNVAVAVAKKARKLHKAERDDDKEQLKQRLIVAALGAIEWNLLVSSVYTDLLAAAQAGIEEGLSQVAASPDYDTGELLQTAEDYAKRRSAEMIGKQYIGTRLYDAPGAKFVIAEVTKDDLTDMIEESVEKEETIEELEKRILLAATFSDMRAKLIAKNETALAQVGLHVDTWRRFEIRFVNVVLSPAHVVVDSCDDLVAQNPWPIENAPTIPDHPNCQCTLVAVEPQQI